MRGMTSKSNVPDAWDDDWVNQADTSQSTSSNPAPAPSKKLTKAERRAQQAEFNRKLWEEAEAENSAYFVESRSDVPLQSGFKPNVTLLSRKPGATAIAKRDTLPGLEQLSVQDDDDEEEDQSKAKPLTAEERAIKAQREREEKQKKYDEARERLFGTSSTSPGTSSPRSNTPVRNNPGDRGRGRGRGDRVKDPKENRDSRPGSSASAKSKQLYDPSYAPKPDSVYLQRREAADPGVTPAEDQIVRNPRGPDGSGRGGIGFVRRGGERT